MNRYRKILSLICIGGLGLLLARAVAFRPNKKRAFAASPRPLAFAHRGGKDLWPENTIYAFEKAAHLGVHVLELDVHLTGDLEVVVHHDPDVDRTSDGSGLIADQSLAELQELDFGARFPFPEGESPGPLRIATLKQIFEHFPDHGVNIDIKPDGPDCARATAQVILEANAVDRVLVTSFFDEPIRLLRQSLPEMATGTSEIEIRAFFVLSKLGLERLLRPRGLAYQVPAQHGGLRVVTPQFVEAAHRLGQEVHVWTINDPEEMQALLEMGVDGLMSDRPDLLMEVLESR